MLGKNLDFQGVCPNLTYIPRLLECIGDPVDAGIMRAGLQGGSLLNLLVDEV